jgi:glucosamine-6-phosphate deaminase
MTEPRRFRAGNLKIEVYGSRKAAGEAAAHAAGESLRQLAKQRAMVGVIFATGASQLETLHALTAIPDLPWDHVAGFHMDEYVGLQANHPASFRRYLRENLTSQVHLAEFHEIDGTVPDPELLCRDYAAALRSRDPQLCLLGIGENGHLAFNDPAEADFSDPVDMKIVLLDTVCRQQQVAEGWFSSVEEVPPRAMTLTIPTLLRVPKLIASVPGSRKARIVKRTLTEPISTACPATIFRTHPDVTVYLDPDSAAEIDELISASGS